MMVRFSRKKFNSVNLAGMVTKFTLFCFSSVRARKSLTSYMKVHRSEVTGLKWSLTGDVLASGGNDNQVYVWNSSKMSSSRYMYRLKEHSAAVKALAWCPYNYDVLASGGGTMDGCIKLWNINNGTCNQSISTQTQVGWV